MSRDSTSVITGAPSHRYGYHSSGAARDRAAAGTAEAAAAGEAPGEPPAWPRAHQAALTPEKPHPCHIAPVIGWAPGAGMGPELSAKGFLGLLGFGYWAARGLLGSGLLG